MAGSKNRGTTERRSKDREKTRSQYMATSQRNDIEQGRSDRHHQHDLSQADRESTKTRQRSSINRPGTQRRRDGMIKATATHESPQQREPHLQHGHHPEPARGREDDAKSGGELRVAVRVAVRGGGRAVVGVDETLGRAGERREAVAKACSTRTDNVRGGPGHGTATHLLRR